MGRHGVADDNRDMAGTLAILGFLFAVVIAGIVGLVFWVLRR